MNLFPSTNTYTEKPSKVLPNLDALRAIAALLVIVSHVELQKEELGFSNLRPLVKNFGALGVTLFFVLSGFLITWLLTQEHESKGGIHIRKFYWRRILRIWPLYFAVLTAGIAIYYRSIQPSAIVLSLFFLPNIAFMKGLLPSLIDPIWSLGVEEQFYLFHPHFFRLKKIKTIFNLLLILLVLLYLLKFSASHFHWAITSLILYKARFDCMLLGSIFSIWVMNEIKSNSWFKPLLSPSFLFSKNLQRLLYASFILYIGFSITHAHYYNDQLLSILAAIIIVNLALNPATIIHLRFPLLEQLGKISFGLYLLHKFPLTWILSLLKTYEVQNNWLINLACYGLAIALSIVQAKLSFRYYEGYFLKLKEKKYSGHH